MTIVLKVEFQGAVSCSGRGDFAESAQAWVASFPEAWNTGLLTLPSNPPLLRFMNHGTLYIFASDNVTPNTFAGLARQWTRDCIVVDKISQVAAQPDQSQEQADLDSKHKGIFGNVEDALNAIFRDLKILVILLLIGAALFIAWESGALAKFRKGKP